MDFQKGNASIAQTEGKLKGITKQADTFRSSIGRVGAALGITFAASQLISFTKQMTKLGDEVLDVRKRFQQINQSGALLGNLRKDTKGLIDDLSLMKAAVRAENFRVPLTELGKLLEFARKRANDTGQSVERMTELILEGVGKKSVKSLQEFGLSAAEVNEELARTPDFAKAIGNIATREFAKAADGATDFGDEIDKLNTEIQNLTQRMSIGFTTFFGTFAKGINEASDTSLTFGERLAGIGTSINQIIQASPQLAAALKLATATDIFGIFDTTEMDKVNARAKAIREEQEKLAKDAQAAGAAVFGALSPKQLEATELSFNDIVEIIKQLREQANALPPDSTIAAQIRKDADALEEQLNVVLGKVKEVNDAEAQAREDFLKWIDEQDAIYGAQNEQADLAIQRGKEKNDVLRDEIDLTNKINQANEDIAAFDATHGGGADDITAEKDAIELRNKAMLASLQIFQSIGQLAGKQKAAALASIAINQAIAISEAVKDAQVAGITPIEKFAIYAAMIAQILGGIAQAKAALSQAQGFAEGVIGIQGEGTSKSDSIPARLSKGESVMTAEETDDYSDVLWAIRNGNFDDYIQKNLFDFINPSVINKQFEKSTIVREVGQDYSQRFYQQLLATGEGNYYTKTGLKYLKSIDRKLSQTPSRYARP